MAYIKGAERVDVCFLCDAATSSPDQDESKLVVARGETSFVILNLFPYNTGHLMVAPYRHIAELDDLEHAEYDEIWTWTRKAVAALRQASQPQGFNIGINLGEVAGAGVPGHFHLHVVPRWGGDTNFMPVVGDAKVLPEMLSETYARLRPLLA
ncbi:MAG: HIT domain-containing protein [Actinomycetota bacterium]